MKPLGFVVIAMAVVLALVGMTQIVQQVQQGQITRCQAAIVDQFVAASGPRAEAADVKDQAEADMASTLLDKTASQEDKLKKFQAWVDAVENLVAVKAANPLPPPPTSVCGES